MFTREQSIKYYDCTQHYCGEFREKAYVDRQWPGRQLGPAMPVLAVDDYHAHRVGPGPFVSTLHAMWNRFGR